MMGGERKKGEVMERGQVGIQMDGRGERRRGDERSEMKGRGEGNKGKARTNHERGEKKRGKRTEMRKK